MQEPQFRDRFFNPDAEYPMMLGSGDFKAAIEEVYDEYHRTNEFFLDEFGIRFNNIFRAWNAFGGFIGHRFNEALIGQDDRLCHNPNDDRPPDITHKAFRAAARQMDSIEDEVDGIEQKAAKYDNGLTSHNKTETYVLFTQYRVKEPDVIRDDLEPFEFTKILCVKAEGLHWNKHGRKGDSNRNVTYTPKPDLRHALRSNPIYEHPDAIKGQQPKKDEYRQNHANFDPVYADENPEYATQQATL